MQGAGRELAWWFGFILNADLFLESRFTAKPLGHSLA
jgi:hypothetical protein